MRTFNPGWYKIFLAQVVLLMCFHVTAVAQVSCPPGTMPYGAGQELGVCGPIPGYDGPAPQQQAPPVKWASRWGAVATDGDKGSLGVATDMPSRRAAEKEAMSDCKTKGGEKCGMDVSYGNSCVAMLVGDSGYSIRTGRTTDEAVAFATKACSEKYKNCHIYYSSCSLPVRIQ